MSDRLLISLLRYWSLSDASYELGIHEHPEVLELEKELQQTFLTEFLREKNLEVN